MEHLRTVDGLYLDVKEVGCENVFQDRIQWRVLLDVVGDLRVS